MRNSGLQLLGLTEVVMRAFSESRTSELDDPLIPFGVFPLIDGKGNVTGADEKRHRGRRHAGLRERRFEFCFIVLRIAAQRARRRHVGDHQADRPITFGLEREDAFVFECAGQYHGKRNRFAEHRRDRLRVIMLRQDAIDCRAQPDETPAQRKGIDPKGLDEIVGGGVAGRIQDRAFQSSKNEKSVVIRGVR